MKFFDFHHHKNYPYGIYNLNILETPPEFYFSAGIHPKDISVDFEEQFSWLKEVSQHQNCVAIGECGLDGLIDVNEKIQEKILEKQILWANEIQKPLIIHCVRRFSEILKFKKLAKVPMIIHGFNKKQTISDELLQHGFYLSFGKALLQNVSLQKIVADFPIEKMFLETDGADLNIADLYEKVSELKEISIENLKQQILENLDLIISKADN